MPELPDVEVFKFYFDRTALHHRITGITIESESILEDLTPQVLGQRLKGHQFEQSRRHGKYLFGELDDHHWVVFHFGMSGRLETYARTPPEGTRATFSFADSRNLALVMPRKLGHLGWSDDLEAYLKQKGLGIDILDTALDRDRFRQLARQHRGAIKCWLMDQSELAGLGNIYSDEALFQAHIHPKRKIEEMDDDLLDRLHACIRSVAQTAIKHHANPAELPPSYLLPKRREGGRCPRCGGEVKKISACGRSAYLCPACQHA